MTILALRNARRFKRMDEKRPKVLQPYVKSETIWEPSYLARGSLIRIDFDTGKETFVRSTGWP